MREKAGGGAKDGVVEEFVENASASTIALLAFHSGSQRAPQRYSRHLAAVGWLLWLHYRHRQPLCDGGAGADGSGGYIKRSFVVVSNM